MYYNSYQYYRSSEKKAVEVKKEEKRAALNRRKESRKCGDIERREGIVTHLKCYAGKVDSATNINDCVAPCTGCKYTGWLQLAYKQLTASNRACNNENHCKQITC